MKTEHKHGAGTDINTPRGKPPDCWTFTYAEQIGKK